MDEEAIAHAGLQSQRKEGKERRITHLLSVSVNKLY
jgi:hypothetical protein